MMLGCMHALLLLAEAATQLVDVHGRTVQQWAEEGQLTPGAEFFRQHAAPSPPQRVAASLAAQPDAGEPALSPPAAMPLEIKRSAEQGELHKVVRWLGKGGPVDALCSAEVKDGPTTTAALLHVAATNGHVEMVRILLKRGASVDLQTGIGYTALMTAAGYGRLPILSLLLQHSANPNLQSGNGQTALIVAAGEGQEACVQALLRAGANTELRTTDGRNALRWAEGQGHEAVAELIRQHAAPPHLAVLAPPAAPPNAGEVAVSSPPTLLPREIFQSAQQGKLQEVVKWLGKGGSVDAVCSVPTDDGRTASVALLHTTAASGRLEVVRELLKRGASVNLQSSLGGTALMGAASYGHLSTLHLLLQHSANPDLQDKYGNTALMMAAGEGREACVHVLLSANANTELLDVQGRTAQQWAEIKGHPATAKLFQQHACRSLGLSVALCAVLPLARPWMMPWVVLGAIALVAALTAGLVQHRAARQRRPRRPARSAKAKGRTTTAEPIRQHAAPPQPAAATMKAKRAARADAATEDLLAEEAERAKGQARSKKSKKKNKVGGPTAPGDGGLSALERALVAVPREVRESGVAAEARAQCDTLLKWRQDEAECEARQEAAAEAARLAVAERVQGAAAREAVRVAAAAEEREEAEAAVTALATAIEEAAAAAATADVLEQAMADGSEGSSSGAAGPSEASGAVEVPDDYICSITAEIMTDPVCTADGFTYEREAITEWLRTNNTSPLTGATLESKVLIPNLSFRSIICRFVAAQASTAL